MTGAVVAEVVVAEVVVVGSGAALVDGVVVGGEVVPVVGGSTEVEVVDAVEVVVVVATVASLVTVVVGLDAAAPGTSPMSATIESTTAATTEVGSHLERVMAPGAWSQRRTSATLDQAPPQARDDHSVFQVEQ